MSRRSCSYDGCPHTRSIAALLLGALAPPERRQIMRHLRGCDDCRAEIIELAPLAGLLNRLRPR
jgi:anti-sigma factor RsiW